MEGRQCDVGMDGAGWRGEGASQRTRNRKGARGWEGGEKELDENWGKAAEEGGEHAAIAAQLVRVRPTRLLERRAPCHPPSSWPCAPPSPAPTR